MRKGARRLPAGRALADVEEQVRSVIAAMTRVRVPRAREVGLSGLANPAPSPAHRSDACDGIAIGETRWSIPATIRSGVATGHGTDAIRHARVSPPLRRADLRWLPRVRSGGGLCGWTATLGRRGRDLFRGPQARPRPVGHSRGHIRAVVIDWWLGGSRGWGDPRLTCERPHKVRVCAFVVMRKGEAWPLPSRGFPMRRLWRHWRVRWRAAVRRRQTPRPRPRTRRMPRRRPRWPSR